ncbi:MAG: NAD(P)/FAD-dependent oxidoreductase [Anaerolineae bacterium]|jgi:cation diffusion facilitator CzcD-associated flavoprotein CzcO|nr:NAD(P)/FAD-dependent oxidoreductase [Anaerolineae bacterium]
MVAAQRAAEDVLIIGAGPAGIVSAYYMQQAGLSYRVVDRAGVIGSTWDSLYPSLRLNTSRFYSHLPGLRFPLRAGLFPSGRQYHEHLLAFVRRHPLHIQLHTTVQRVAPEGGLWRVEMNGRAWLYRAVIAATGIFGGPVRPDIRGLASFSGTLLHAHDFKHPEQVRGQRVLVVGSGPSGVDIAVAAGQTAARVEIAIRSGITLYRRYPYGLPQHAWLLLGLLLPRPWCNRLIRRLTKVEIGGGERYGLKKPPPGVEAVTAYQGPELLQAVRAGRVQPAPAPVQVDGPCVTFADASTREFDTVILATGYRPVLHDYLAIPMEYDSSPWRAPGACDWEIGPNGQRGFPLLDRQQHPNGRQVQGCPGLYVVGVYYKGKGALYNMNVEARIAADQIAAYLRAAAGQ